MLTVHHLGVSQSDRIVWLCEELGIRYALELYDREAGSGRAPPAYRALHPAELAPVITDGDVVLAESGAIVDYIITRHGGGRLRPKAGSPDLPDYLYWFHFANATLQPAAIIELVFRATETAPDPKLAALRERLPRYLGLVEDRLSTVQYFAGERFTAADVMMVFNLSTLPLLSGATDGQPRPNTQNYLARIGERPAFRRAIQRAEHGPLKLP